MSNLKVKEIWQPFYKETLSDLDASDISNNLLALAKLANRWNKNKNNVVEFKKG